jgi:hypothetical protein
VELPIWLPDDIVKEMLSMFERYLVEELLAMARGSKHKYSSSIESINSYSSGSSDGMFSPSSPNND